MPRSRRTRGQHPIKLPPLRYDQKNDELLYRYVFNKHKGKNVPRRRKLPPPANPHTRGELPYSAKPVPRQHRIQVDNLTSGTRASLVGNDLLEMNQYRWRGKANKQAHKVWAQIKDQLPTDVELAKWAKRHELLRDDEIIWE